MAATRFGMGDEIGGMGGGRRADLVLLDHDYKPVNTWYGGELVVEGARSRRCSIKPFQRATDIRTPPITR